MGESSGGVPAWVVGGIVCLLMSIAGTWLYMTEWLGYKRGPTIYETQADASARQGKEGSQAPGTPRAQGDPNQAGPKGDLIKGARGDRPSTHVVTLVAKLDELTAAPAKLQLTADERAKVLPELQELEKPDILGDKPAQEHMLAILKAIGDHRKVLEDAGFKWPSSEMAQPSPPPQNPFKEGDAAKHMKALLDRLAKTA
jgi:hypothetical protein